MGGPLVPKDLHHKNSTAYKSIENKLLNNIYAIAISLLASYRGTDNIIYLLVNGGKLVRSL